MAQCWRDSSIVLRLQDWPSSLASRILAVRRLRGQIGVSPMNRSTLLLATIAATFVAGCASTPITNPAAAAQDEKTVVTGSRLPSRDRDSSSSVKSIDNKQGIDDMMQRGSGIFIPPKGGAI
jgi:hypothetical protein